MPRYPLYESLNIAGGVLDNRALDAKQGIIQSNSAVLDIDAATVHNDGGRIQHAGSTRLDLSAGQLNNTRGQLLSAAQAKINASYTNNTRGVISADVIDVDGAVLTNSGGNIVARDVNLNLTDSLTNTSTTLNGTSYTGLISAIGDSAKQTMAALRIVVGDLLDNTSGRVETDATSTALTAGSLNNSSGNIMHLGQGTLTATLGSADTTDNHLTNTSGVLYSAGSLSVTADDVLTNSGTVSASKNLSLLA